MSDERAKPFPGLMTTIQRFAAEMIDVSAVLLALLALFALVCSLTVPVSMSCRGLAFLATLAFLGPLAIRTPMKIVRRLAVGAVSILAAAFVLLQSRPAQLTLPPEGRILRIPGEEPPNALSDIVDERDIVLLGARVLPWIGGVTPTEAEGLVEAVERAYDEMRTDGRYVSTVLLQSMLDFGARESFEMISFGIPVDAPAASVQSRTAIVFLHGFGGNFGLLCWRVARIGRAAGAATFCPSLGLIGLWGSAEGKRRVEETIRYVRRKGFERVVLAGLSNGAVGATELALPGALEHAEGTGIDGALLLFGAHPSLGRIGLPTLAVYGDSDERFPPRFIEWCAKVPRSAAETDGSALPRVTLELRRVRGNHMTLLGDMNETAAVISDWLTRLPNGNSALTQHDSPAVGDQDAHG